MYVVRNPKINFEVEQEFAVDVVGDVYSPLRVGDRVSTDTVVFEGQGSDILQSLDVCKTLGVPAKDAKDFVLVGDGEIVDKGDIVAKRKVSLGMLEKIAKAGYEGRLSLSRIDSGVIDIMSPFSDSSTTAGVKGIVKHIIPEGENKRRMIIETSGHVAKPFVFTGGSASGTIGFIKDGDSVYRAEDVSSVLASKIVVSGRKLTVKLYEALVEVGANGIIVGGMDNSEFHSVESFAIPVFISEGWGTIPINISLYNILKNSEDGLAYLDVDTNQLLICSDSAAANGSSQERVLSWVRLKTGDKVQIWNYPYWAFSGEVVGILDDENLVQIKLVSGKKVTVRGGMLSVIE
ncbi:hypothetical protein JW710_00030 [Candidatus Dojkabacteria bacterium]|nr:hypothetical protein [Candidatus Dojkabacteria bacterium]